MKRMAAVLGVAVTALALFPVARAVAAVDTTADLKVSVTGPASVTPGGSATYVMTIRNEGPDTVQSVGMQATWSRDFSVLSNGLTGVSGPCGWTSGSPGVSCGVAGMPMAAGEARTVTFTGTVHQDAFVPVQLTASVSSSGNTDPVPADDTGQATSLIEWACGAAGMTPAPAAHFAVTRAVAVDETTADLKVSVTGPASVTPGCNATYVMTIRNEGPDTLQSVGMHATWSRNFDLPSYGLTGVSGFCGWTSGSPDVSCGVARMPMTAGESRTVTFTGTVDENASGQVQLTASVSSSGNTDPVPADDTGQATSLVEPAPTRASR